MTVYFAWICAFIAGTATLGAAYFFDKSADERMAIARNEAAQAIRRTADLEITAETLRKSNRELDLAQEEIRKQNLELAIQLAKEQSSHQDLTSKVSSRHMTPEQKAALVKAITGFNGPVTVTRLGDQEAYSYATEILNALNEAQVKLIVIKDVGTHSPPIYGLQLRTPEIALVKALENAHIDHQISPMRSLGGSSEILVGLRPSNL